MLWAVGLLAALVTITLLVATLYPDIWQGLSRERRERVALFTGIAVAVTTLIVLLAIGGASLGWTGFGDKTVWDWLQLLSALALPVMLTVAGFWFAAQQDEREAKRTKRAQEIEDRRADQAQRIENQRAESEQEIEEQRAQDAALQEYLNEMSTLLIDGDLRKSEDDSEVRTLAQARTATVIQRLDAEGNRNVIRFLNEARLTEVGQASMSLLAGADLQGAHLDGVDLSTIDLSGAILRDAHLSGATLDKTILNGANLSEADLRDANLLGAELSGAYLREANLSSATLDAADLNGANLSEANLSGADLINATLNDADLSEADLSGANLNEADLSSAGLLSANLSNANLFGAILENAKLSGATLHGIILGGNALSSADLDSIFKDNFSDPPSGWNIEKGSEKAPYIIEYAAGGLRIHEAPPPSHTQTLNDSAGTEIEDSTVEVDATVTGNAPESLDPAWGIVCRALDDANYYTLGIYADGTPSISKLQDHKWTNLAIGSPITTVRGGTDKHHLRADCLGSKLTLYVNGRRVLQAEDSEFKSGQLGVFAEDSYTEEAIDVLFDDFLVKGPRPVILQDDFSDPPSGWNIVEGSEKEPYVIEYAAGGLRLYNPVPDNQIFSIYNYIGEIEDTTVEVDGSVSGSPAKDTTWGIICRRVDDANYYTLGISGEGRPEIWKLKDQKWTELRTGKPSDAVHGGTDKHHLRADCLGSKLTLYVNGRRVLQAEDSEFKSGQLGVFAEQRSGGATDVSFDNFLVNSP